MIKGKRDDSTRAQTRTGKEGGMEEPLPSVAPMKGKKSKEGYNNYYFVIGLMTKNLLGT